MVRGAATGTYRDLREEHIVRHVAEIEPAPGSAVVTTKPARC
jgi:hypothetical protein